MGALHLVTPHKFLEIRTFALLQLWLTKGGYLSKSYQKQLILKSYYEIGYVFHNKILISGHFYYSKNRLYFIHNNGTTK